VLPFRAGPGAVHSAAQRVGASRDDIADRVRADLRGRSTCTHLNSTLRCLADVGPLLTALLPR
jgi:hypothetical protein